MVGLVVGAAGRLGQLTFRGLLVGVAFFGVPTFLVASAVSARTAGVVDSWDTIRARLIRYLPKARAAAADAGVPLDLLLAVATVESAGRPDARSGAGAVGLMQLLPSTATELAAEAGEPRPDLTDAATSLRLGARYLRRQIDAFAQEPASIELALCAYNAGPGRVREWMRDEPPPRDGEPLGSWIRFGETRAFVHRVQVARERWRADPEAARSALLPPR